MVRYSSIFEYICETNLCRMGQESSAVEYQRTGRLGLVGRQGLYPQSVATDWVTETLSAVSIHRLGDKDSIRNEYPLAGREGLYPQWVSTGWETGTLSAVSSHGLGDWTLSADVYPPTGRQNSICSMSTEIFCHYVQNYSGTHPGYWCPFPR
jgi:hypothetical protein